ncbi:MAG: hypothetical protein GY759_08340 [Chloroflexi bacterium]|nr:hypothetical protein [Chloroflexota bacterium]
MAIDYFEYLSQANEDLKTVESATVCYHKLAGQNDNNLMDYSSTPLWQYIQNPAVDLTILPPYSFSLTFSFRLAQPYISKDDNPFYIIDNPIVRDKVFRLPMVRPSGWKGSLRHALWLQDHRDKKYMRRLFGAVDGTNDRGQSGRLLFYPTFFTETSREIINPHDRVRRVGKNPIIFESVPIGATGQFTLLYVPFDRISNRAANPEKGLKSLLEEVAEDIQLLAQGLQAMFTLYGFGAKTSSGFGFGDDQVSDGLIRTNVPDAEQQVLPPQEPVMPQSLAVFLKEFPDEDFRIKPNEWRQRHGATTSQRNRYRDARSESVAFQQALQIYQTDQAEWETGAVEPAQCFLETPFETFTGLATDVVEDLTEKLMVGGAE